MTVQRTLIWDAPAEVDPRTTAALGDSPCDCYWHRRIFTHIAVGSFYQFDERDRLPLARTVKRTDHGNGRIDWLMTLKVEGMQIEVERCVWPWTLHSGHKLGSVTFSATAGDPRVKHGAVRLESDRPLSRRTAKGGDPTLVWRLPEQIGAARWPAGSTLVIWAEAWWWRIAPTGDPLTSFEQTLDGEISCGNDGDDRDILSLQ